jgi:hypothetical protein
MLQKLFSFLNSDLVIGPSEILLVGPEEKLVIRPQAYPTVTVSGTHQLERQIKPVARGLWNERGWQKRYNGRGQIYDGNFQITNSRSRRRITYRGRIHINSRAVELFIYDPPPEIKRHPKGPCFSPAGLPWFRLHWHRPATNVDDAILYMEKILFECVG